MRTKMGLCLVACVLVALVCPINAADEKTKFDPAKLVGTWTYVTGEKEGTKLDAAKLKGQTVVITKDTLTLKGEATFVMKYTIDATKSPPTISMTITESPFGAGAKSEGIIELDGDNLKFAYAAPEGKVPTKFETKEGSKQHFFTLKRSK